MSRAAKTTRSSPARKRAATKPRAAKAATNAPAAKPADGSVSFLLPREELVELAINAVLVGPRKGVKLAAMRLHPKTMSDAARRSILSDETDTEIFASHAKEMKRAKVTESSFRTWLQRVRREFGRFNQMRAMSMLRLEQSLSDTDLVAQSRAVNRLLMSRTLLTLSNLDDLATLDPEVAREVTRAVQQITAAARLELDADMAKVKVEKFKAEIAKLQRESDKPATNGDMLSAFFAMLSSLGRDDLVAEIQKGGAA